jgi:general secretion pathway protein J
MQSAHTQRVRHPARRRRRSSGGFTLLELLVAMALMGAVALSLYGTIGTVFRARRTAMAAAQRTRSVEVVTDVLRRDIESALLPNGILAGSFIGIDQAGPSADADTLEFYGTAPGARSTELASVINRITWLLVADERDPERSELVRQVTGNLLAQVESEPEQEVLCRDVRALNIRYYDGFDWVDGWDSTTAASPEMMVPRAIEVVLELELPTSAGTLEPVTVTRVFRPTYMPQMPEESFQTTTGVMP